MMMLGMVTDISGCNSSAAGLAHHIGTAALGMGKVNDKLELYSALICLLTVIIFRVRRKNKSNDPLDFLHLIFMNFRYSSDRNSNSLYKIFRRHIFWLALLRLLLLTQSNMTIKNPGPQGMSVMYQNVQGLIPFSELNNKHPSLNKTKMENFTQVCINLVQMFLF